MHLYKHNDGRYALLGSARFDDVSAWCRVPIDIVENAECAANTDPTLFQHSDGRYALSFGLPARFTVGVPAWHRLPIDIIERAQEKP